MRAIRIWTGIFCPPGRSSEGIPGFFRKISRREGYTAFFCWFCASRESVAEDARRVSAGREREVPLKVGELEFPGTGGRRKRRFGWNRFSVRGIGKKPRFPYVPVSTSVRRGGVYPTVRIIKAHTSEISGVCVFFALLPERKREVLRISQPMFTNLFKICSLFKNHFFPIPFVGFSSGKVAKCRRIW